MEITLSIKSSAWTGSLCFLAGFEEDGRSDIASLRYLATMEKEGEERGGEELRRGIQIHGGGQCCVLLRTPGLSANPELPYMGTRLNINENASLMTLRVSWAHIHMYSDYQYRLLHIYTYDCYMYSQPYQALLFTDPTFTLHGPSAYAGSRGLTNPAAECGMACLLRRKVATHQSIGPSTRVRVQYARQRHIFRSYTQENSPTPSQMQTRLLSGTHSQPSLHCPGRYGLRMTLTLSALPEEKSRTVGCRDKLESEDQR